MILTNLKRIWKDIPCTIVIIGICTLVYILIALQVFVPAASGMAVLLGCYYKPFILAGEVWRLLTCGFVHTTIWHLIMNMFAFYNLGSLLERRYGAVRYLILLFGSVIGGSLFLMAASDTALAVGLSGGLYGLMSGLFVLFYKAGLMNDPRVRASLLRTAMINLLINLMPGVSVFGHIGGLLTGFLIAMAMENWPQNASLKIHCTIACVLLCGLLAGISWVRKDVGSDPYITFDMSILYYEGTHGIPKGYTEMIGDHLDSIYGTDIIGDTLRYNLEEE